MARSTNTGADKHAVKKPAANRKPAAKKSTAVKNSEKNTEQKEQAAVIREKFSQIAPALLLVLAVFIVLCYVWPDEGRIGIVGLAIRSLCYGLFSGGAVAIPVLLGIAAFFWRRDAEARLRGWKLLFSFLCLLFVSITIHVFGGADLPLNARALWNAGMDWQGGGVCGGTVGILLLRAIGRAGTVIVSATVFLVFGLFLFGQTPHTVMVWLKYKLHEANEKYKIHEEQESMRIRRELDAAMAPRRAEPARAVRQEALPADSGKNGADANVKAAAATAANARRKIRELAQTDSGEPVPEQAGEKPEASVPENAPETAADKAVGKAAEAPEPAPENSYPIDEAVFEEILRRNAANIEPEPPVPPKAEETAGSAGTAEGSAVTEAAEAGEPNGSSEPAEAAETSDAAPEPDADDDGVLPFDLPDKLARMQEGRTVRKTAAPADRPHGGKRSELEHLLDEAVEPSKKGREVEGHLSDTAFGGVAPSSGTPSGPAPKPAAEEGKKASAPPKKPYEFPPLTLLKTEPAPDNVDVREELQTTAKKLVDTLTSFKVRTRIVNVSRGPTITRYELAPEEGIRVRAIANLVDDIALNLATTGVRIEAPIPGKSAVGIEVPNRVVATVHLRELLSAEKFRESKSRITVALGMDVAGEPIFVDIAKMPHLLIAGATGMGKSVCINSMIVSLLYKSTPEEVKLILVDPKKVELNVYNGLPQLLIPVVSDPKKAAGALNWAVTEMERRFELIEEMGVRDLKGYNEAVKDDESREKLPQIVIIIDELADLMMTAPDDVEESICRLAQKARAAGMHIIIGTQRPSVDVITGLIKANVPSRIAFTVASQMDSRVIIDMVGAEKLIGRGDMLYAPVGASKPARVQGAFVSEDEVAAVCDFIKRQDYGVSYDDAVLNSIEEAAAQCGAKKGARLSNEDGEEGDDEYDPMLKPAIELAVESGKISTSLIQRRLSLGYGRSAKLIDRMENMGIVSPPEGQKPRSVLITRQQYMEMVLNKELE